MHCPSCSGAMPRARLLTSLSGRVACPRCRVQVRPRLKRKGALILALALAQVVNLSAVWVANPVVAIALLVLGGAATVLTGLLALYSFEPALVD